MGTVARGKEADTYIHEIHARLELAHFTQYVELGALGEGDKLHVSHLNLLLGRRLLLLFAARRWRSRARSRRLRLHAEHARRSV